MILSKKGNRMNKKKETEEIKEVVDWLESLDIFMVVYYTIAISFLICIINGIPLW